MQCSVPAYFRTFFVPTFFVPTGPNAATPAANDAFASSAFAPLLNLKPLKSSGWSRFGTRPDERRGAADEAAGLMALAASFLAAVFGIALRLANCLVVQAVSRAAVRAVYHGSATDL